MGTSLINVAVKSVPPSPCPLCCSVLVPPRCSQSQKQIATLMMDIHTPNPTNPRLSRVTAPSSSLCSQGKAERGSQPVRRPCSPHQFTESRRQPCILTSLALTSSRGRGGGRSKRGDRSRGGTEGVSSCRNDTTPDCVRDHCCYFILGPNLAVRLEAH